MKIVMEIIKIEEYDRFAFLFIDKAQENEYADGIIGINFHQGCDNLMMEFGQEANPHLTEVWRRLTLNYPNVEHYFLVNQAIELYCDAFIHQQIKLKS